MRKIVNPARGFTLIEIIVSIVAFSILMTMLMPLLFDPQKGLLKRGTDSLYRMRAAELGQSYLEEMLGKRYDENSPLGNSLRCNALGQPACSATLGPDAGETTHNTFDDFDDYNNFTDGSSTTAPTDQSGNPRPNYVGFIVTATVVYAGSELGLPNNTDAKRANLTVTDPRGDTYLFSVYKTNF